MQPTESPILPYVSVTMLRYVPDNMEIRIIMYMKVQLKVQFKLSNVFVTMAEEFPSSTPAFTQAAHASYPDDWETYAASLAMLPTDPDGFRMPLDSRLEFQGSGDLQYL